MSLPPSPFPPTPAAHRIGAYGAWDGDDAETPQEVHAAQIHAPSVLSQVIAGERIQVRPRCEQCGSVLLRDNMEGTWCPTCVSHSAFGQADEDTPVNEVYPTPLDAYSLASQPVIREIVLKSHQCMIERSSPPPPPARGTLRWDASILGFRIEPGDDSPLWDRVRADGIQIDLTYHF
jgi:hypothetical protein